MAEITIKIKDIDNGKVSVELTPNFETLAKMENAGHHLTSAHGYALTAVNAIRQAARQPQTNLDIIIPKVRGGGLY